MKPEAQRIAIATACGWIEPFTEVDDDLFATHPSWVGKDGITGSQVEHVVPDYLNDLNAMHSAEKVLDDDINDGGSNRYRYANYLYRTVPVETQPMRATAAQRAEAFLKTIGKWREE